MSLTRAIFHHVPKSGGTYVIRALKEAGIAQKRTAWWQNDAGIGRAQIEKYPAVFFQSSHHAFLPDRFMAEPDEYYFTWVRNPVEMVYSAYGFWTGRGAKNMQNPQPNDLYRRIQEHQTLESYVDTVLASEDLFFPESVYTSLDLKAFDFVGSAHRMAHDITCLTNALGRPLGIHPPPVNVSGVLYEYRRAELEERLAPELAAVEEWL